MNKFHQNRPRVHAHEKKYRCPGTPQTPRVGTHGMAPDSAFLTGRAKCPVGHSEDTSAHRVAMARPLPPPAPPLPASTHRPQSLGGELSLGDAEHPRPAVYRALSRRRWAGARRFSPLWVGLRRCTPLRAESVGLR